MTVPSSLEDRVKLLEDIESIKKLTATYAHYVDRGWNERAVNAAGLPTVFAEDATWKYDAGPVDVSGRDTIVAMLTGPSPAVFAQHSFSNPIIDVDGDTATGSWLLWVGVDMGDGAKEVFQSEDLTYVRTSSGWVIKSIDLRFGRMLG